MGYCINQEDISFSIKKENFPGALKALNKAVNEDHTVTDWVSEKDVSGINDPQEALKELLEECRWQPTFDSDGNISDLDFTGEKYGDDDELFTALAPYVDAGSYIEMRGEDDAHWRWNFDGKTMEENHGKMDYEGLDGIIDAILMNKEQLPTLIGLHPVLDAKIAKVLDE